MEEVMLRNRELANDVQDVLDDTAKTADKRAAEYIYANDKATALYVIGLGLEAFKRRGKRVQP